MKRLILLPVLLMVVFALSRWPGLMPQNFSAVYAMAFCAGLYFPKMWWLPLGTLFLTDVGLNIYYHERHGVNGFNLWLLANYGVYGVIFWLGRKLTRKASFLMLLGGGIIGALLFYLVTNTLSWISLPQYTKTFLGWLQALTTGVPGYPPTWEFFRNTLMGGGLFTGLFVGAMKMTEAKEPEEEKEEKPETEPEEAEA